MNKRLIFILFLFISPFILWAQEETSLITVSKASGTAFTLARGKNLREYSSNLKNLDKLRLQPGDILTTKEKTSIEISIGSKQGRIKLGEKSSLIFTYATPGKNSAFILKKGIVKVQNKIDIPGNSIFIRTATLSTEVVRGSCGIWLHPKRVGSIDTKTEVYCLSGRSDIFVLKKAPNNNWYDKDPEYNEHFILSGNMLSVRSDQAPLAVEEEMSRSQKQWWKKFDLGKETQVAEKLAQEDTPKEEPEEIAKAEEDSTPPSKEDEMIDEEVKESFKPRKAIREKMQRAGIVAMAGSSAMLLTGIVTYAAMPPDSKSIGTVISSIGGGGALAGLVIYFVAYAFPSENSIPDPTE